MEEKNLVHEISVPIYNAKGWLKFLGILMIIYGALSALSIVGLIICWLPIWLGIVLMKASTAIEHSQNLGEKRFLIESLSHIKTYFTITGIMALIGIIVMLLAFIIAGGSILSYFSSIY